MCDVFQDIIDRGIKGQELYKTFLEETKNMIAGHQIMKREPCSFCGGASSFLRSGHPMAPAEYIDCGHCDRKGIERTYEVLDLNSPEVLIALLKEPNGREWFLNGCVS